MSGTTIIPTVENERISWSLNFEEKFSALAAALGFSNQELTALLQDSAAMRNAILTAQAGAAFSKACTAFKNELLGGVGENTATPVAPVYTPPPAPPQTVDAGIIDRLSKAMNRAKLSSGYTKTIGETLRIEKATEDSSILTDAKTTVSATSMTGSIVRLDWKKGKFDGIFIESQRSDETEWTYLDFDMRSPYEDTRPPLSVGKSEERRYRLRYFIDNQAVGAWSDIVVVITIP